MTVEAVPFVLQNGSHSAEVFRHVIDAILGVPTGSFTAATNARSGGAHGVVGLGDFAVSANGTPNMSVNVAAGRALVRGSSQASQGTYGVYNDATVNLAISAAHATLGRRDLIVVQVRDSQYAGADNDARLFVVAGTPAASPADPAVPANSLVLARVTVAAADTSITSGEITDLRSWANALGGRMVGTSAQRTAQPTAQLRDGDQWIDPTTDFLYVWNGSAWEVAADPAFGQMKSFTPALQAASSNPTLGTGSTQAGRYRRIGRRVECELHIAFGTSGAAAGSGQYRVANLPYPTRTPVRSGSQPLIGHGWIVDASPTTLVPVVIEAVGNVSYVVLRPITAPGTSGVADSSPWTWTNNDEMALSFAYETDSV